MYSVRFNNLSDEDKKHAEEWILKAVKFQQEYFEKDDRIPWKSINGDVQLLKEVVRETLSACKSTIEGFSNENNVNVIVNLICEQIGSFSQYKIGFIMPGSEEVGFLCRTVYPLFSVNAPGHSFLIDKNGCISKTLINYLKECGISKPFKYKTLKLHDIQGLFNEIKLSFHERLSMQEEHALSTDEEVNATVRKLCLIIYQNFGLTFHVKKIFVLGKITENLAHYPVFQVAINSSPGKLCCFYVDHIGRFYRDWEHLLNANIYPSSLLCYPRGGTYQVNVSGKIFLDIKQPPGIVVKFKNALKVLEASVEIGSLVIGGTLVATSIGAVVMLCNKLYDSWSYVQSIGKHDVKCIFPAIISGTGAIGRWPLAYASLNTFLSLSNSPDLPLDILMEIKAMDKAIRNINITKEDVDYVFSYINRAFITLKKITIELSEGVKRFFLELWYMWFPIQIHSTTADGISSVISLSEELENLMNVCESEKNFFELAEFVIIWKRHAEKEFIAKGDLMQEILEDNLDKSVMDRECGSTGDSDREEMLKRKENILVELKKLHKIFSEKVPILNESEDLRFLSDDEAMRNCFCCCVRFDSTLTPEEYFALVRRIASDDKLIVDTKECNHGKCIRYYDDDASLTVIVLIAREKKVLISTYLKDDNYD